MNAARLRGFIEEQWRLHVVPALFDYIRIPNKSPMFDPQWAAHGHMERAVQLMADWVRARGLSGVSVEIVRLPGRTPLLFVEIAATAANDETVLIYGHLDKQPEMSGWKSDRGPWTPLIESERLYGRGAGDDGYALFAAMTSVAALRDQGVPHARCVLLIEACEESGSYDLPHYIELLASRIGSPSMIVCLDSGCGNYEQLWLTTSLRGVLVGDLNVRVMSEGVHSGAASGIAPSSFRIARQLLSRLEDECSGEVLLESLHAPVPAEARAQIDSTAATLGAAVHSSLPLLPHVRPMSESPRESLLNRGWRPTLSIIGLDGLPSPAAAGNVLHPATTLTLSLRLPPTIAVEQVADEVKALLERSPPYGAQVSFEVRKAASGWSSVSLPTWLRESVERASHDCFGLPPGYLGEGGTIAFLAMLGARFPESAFIVTGVLGPQSNAHGPNEFLHLPTARRLTACIARMIADHASAPRRE